MSLNEPAQVCHCWHFKETLTVFEGLFDIWNILFFTDLCLWWVLAVVCCLLLGWKRWHTFDFVCLNKLAFFDPQYETVYLGSFFWGELDINIS